MAPERRDRARPISLAVIRRGEDLLVYRGQSRVEPKPYFRPLGGGIEFGERAEAALHRELMEELGVEVTAAHLLGVLENIFTNDGEVRHEIVFVYEALLVDRSLYDRNELWPSLDEGNPVSWQPSGKFVQGHASLYPEGLLDLLVPPAGA